ncbi:MAG: DUF3179 domain-containing protein, partial [Methanosarcinales archaeon]
MFGFKLWDKVRAYHSKKGLITGYITGLRSNGSFEIRSLEKDLLAGGITFRKLELIKRSKTNYLTEGRCMRNTTPCANHMKRCLLFKIKISIIVLGIVGLIALTGCLQEKPKQLEKLPEIREIEKEMGINMTARGVKYLVDPEKIVSGGPPKDGIPSIDNPKYVTVEEADKWIQDNELVLAIIYKDVKRVYPLQIMVWHEIVNDVIAGDPILITYCPLCGSGIAYERTINGEEVEFGTSGKLYNSNLVMYDRKTNSYWSQIDGLAIVGELTGTKLTAVSIDTVVWRDWKKAHPDSEVLSQDTGFIRPYGRDPYGN